MLGMSGLPSLPLAERGAPTEENPEDFALLVERLAAQMAENPSDPRGWLLLARSYARVERFADSASAYRRAIELGTREVRSEEHTSELQTLMRISNAVFSL